ncbi:MAG: SdrD B-like domain-containing protein, partial [Caldilineaceae bacterium]
NTTIDGGQTKVLTGLASGLYTVTESTPAGWTTIYTATPGMGGNSRAVVNLSNAGNVTPVTPAAIAGKVYQDYNSNGQLDTDPDAAIDASINGVTVTAYDPNGNACGNTTSDTNGNYSLTPTCNGPWRLVFSTLPAGYEPSTHGVGNGTSVQFISAGASNVNFAVQRSEDYCQNNPQLCTVLSRYGINSGVNGNAVVAATFPYNAGSNAAGPYGGGFTAYDTPAPGLNRTFSQLGSLYGIAYSKQRKSLYLGALMKRHMSFGPGGPGAIYQVDPATGNVTTFATLNAGTDPHPATANEVSGLCTPVDGVGAAYNPSFGPDGATNCFFNDPYSFAAVGKRGLGDIDLNGDEDELYVINLFDRNLYRLNATTGAVLGNVAPPTPASCTATLRPFGLGQRGDVMFVGMVCDDATNAYVYSYSPAAGYSAAPVLQFALNYARDLSATFFGCVGPATWRQWSDVLPADLLCSPNDYNLAHAQPILSDIEFDNNGNMLIGLRDRLGDQTSSGSGGIDPTGADTGSKIVFAFAGGDLLKACANGATWVIEGTSGCPQNAGQESGVSEWYNGDTHGVASPQQHQEISMGGLAHIPGHTTTVLSVYDPIRDYQENTNLDTVFDQGVRWFNDTTGGFRRGYRLVDLNLDQVLNSPEGGFGKANGIGDVEALCDLAPIEIGNRVWDDLNGNGIQDPGEPGINGLTVSLQGPTNTVTVVTSDDGNYYFDVSRTTAYTLTITPPGGYSVTKPNAAALTGASVSSNHAISDTIDSDAVLVSGAATIYYTSGSAGQNNHGLDFGFTQPASGQVDILNIAPAVVANSGGFSISKAIATTDGSSPSVSGTFAVVVSCPGVSGYPATLNLNANGTPVTAGNLAAGTVCTFSENTLTLPNAPTGYTWVNATISPASITIASNLTATVTAHNTLAPLPTPPTNVLTVTKSISGTGSGPFNLTITGPSGYVTNTTIDGGQTKVLTGLASGVYTVTESTPAGWTTVYTATTSAGSVTGSTNGVVALQNSNTATLAITPITGTVFRDYNSNGVMNATGVAPNLAIDSGVSGVTVTAYDRNSNAVGSATSAANGTYTLNPTAAGPYRIAFTTLPVGYEPTTHGAGNGTSTQFVTTVAGASNVNLGINHPADYTQTAPKVLNVMFQNGDPLVTGSTVASSQSIVQWNYSNTGTTPAVTLLATAGTTGALWGTALQRSSKTLLTSAVIRRHAGLGPNGVGAIYRTALATNATSLLVDVNTLAGVNVGTIASNAARGLLDVSDPTIDSQAFDAVGKVGIGQIELSGDEKTLFFTNLADRSVYGMVVGIPAATPTSATQYAIPATACTKGEARPWALKQYRNTLYVGVVCSGENAAASPTQADLSAHVYAMDLTATSPAFAATPVITFPLDYNKGCAVSAEYFTAGNSAIPNPPAAALNLVCRWNPWTATMSPFASFELSSIEFAYPQPILSDIDFDADGAMLLSFSDRAAMQLGSLNYLPTDIPGTDQANKLVDNGGDLLRAYRTGAATWILESGGDKDGPGPFTPTVNNTQLRNTKAGGGAGPGGQGPGGGEFYYADSYLDDHEETVIGSVLVYPGSGEAMVTFMDPFGYDSSGVAKFSSATGGRLSAYRTRNGTIAHFGKSASMGELELLVDPAPIEIGNRVWDDLDGDGVQDPGEPGLNGVQVTLQAPTGTVGTVNTSGDGNYYFGNLQANTHYTLTITSAPAGYSVTTPNAAALSGASVSSNHAISDTIDSDAVLVGGVATIYYTTGSAGQNNHGLDFGFTQPAHGQVDILNIAPAPVPNPGGFSISKAIATTDGSSPSVSGTFAVVVSCPGVSGYPATLNLNANGTPVTAGNLAAGTVCTFSENTLTLPNAPTGYTWVNATISPASITIASNLTATVTARNTLSPLPTPPTNVLTVTKTISGTGSGPFDITIAGPSGYMTNTQIDDGDVLTFNVPSSGLYTVTESTPAGWTTVYTATPGSVSSISGVVTVANENTATLSSTPISGKVFRDYNSDGQITANGTVTDTGVSGVTVTAYDKNGNAVGSATSASDGAYTINPTGDGPYRIEFTNLPSGYEPTTHGTQNGTSTQFVTTAGGATNVNLGVNVPEDHAQDAPRLAIARWTNGNSLATGANEAGLRGAVLSFAEDASGVTPVFSTDVANSQIGTVWGLAWQRSRQQLFAAATVRRHAGLNPDALNSGGGLGNIYVLDYTSGGTPAIALLTDLDNLGVPGLDVGSIGSNAARGLPNSPLTPNHDLTAFAKVAKEGLGDLELSTDGNTLYVTNLFQRQIVAIDLTAYNSNGLPITAAHVQQLALPTVTCNNGVARPWGLKSYRNQLYAGLTCTGENGGTTADLVAYVYAYDGTTWTTKLTIPLNYQRWFALSGVGLAGNRAWTDNFSDLTVRLSINNESTYEDPQLLLADIEFAPDGDMLVGFLDRTALQLGANNYGADTIANTTIYFAYSAGELLRADYSAGTYTLENRGVVGGSSGCGAGTTNPYPNSGPGGGEFYCAEQLGGHTETILGGLAQVPGQSRVVANVMDPINFNTGGTEWFSHRTGASLQAAQFYSGSTRTSFGKAAGLGDIEILLDQAPIEIGNRVWNDLNGDGVQDPGEPGLNGVQVTLQAPTGTVGTVNTSGDGNYYFGNLQANTHYTLTITSAPAGYSVTTPNAVALTGASVSSNHAISDTRDSDAVLVGGVATIYYTTGSSGQNNHGLDFGFTQPASGQVDILNTAPVASLGNRVWYDTNNNGTVDSGEQN